MPCAGVQQLVCDIRLKVIWCLFAGSFDTVFPDDSPMNFISVVDYTTKDVPTPMTVERSCDASCSRMFHVPRAVHVNVGGVNYVPRYPDLLFTDQTVTCRLHRSLEGFKYDLENEEYLSLSKFDQSS